MKIDFNLPLPQKAQPKPSPDKTGATEFEKLLQGQNAADKTQEGEKPQKPEDIVAQPKPEEEPATDLPVENITPEGVPLIMPLIVQEAKPEAAVPVVTLEVPMTQGTPVQTVPEQPAEPQPVKPQAKPEGEQIVQQPVQTQTTEAKQPVQTEAKPVVVKAEQQPSQPVQTTEAQPSKEVQQTAQADKPQTDQTTKATADAAQNKADVAAEAKQPERVQPVQQKTETAEEPTVLLHAEPEPLNLEKVNIKVAEAPEVDAEAFVKELAKEITIKVDQNANQLTIKLNPKELGEISIKIAFEGNQVLISMSCTNPKTQSLLAANAANIRSIMEANVGQHTVVTVQEEQNAQQYKNDDYSQNENQNKQKHEQKQPDRTDPHQTEVFLNRLRLGMIDFAG